MTMNSIALRLLVFLSAAIGIGTVYLLHSDELGRRLGDYFNTYFLTWIFVISIFIFIDIFFDKYKKKYQFVVICFAIGYLSSVMAYIFAVVLNPGARHVTHTMSLEVIWISLIGPFVSLYGWLFCIVFLALAFLSRLAVLRMGPKALD